jgi:phosphate transport system permease protein
MRGGAAGGIWGPLIGTFYLTVLCLLIVAPVGSLAGIYLNEYAPDNRLTRAIMIAVTSLAGVPSIVHALFGLGAFVAAMHMNKSLLVAAATLAVMTLPVIITSTREALAAVPRNFREACWNLGATRWQTIRTIVLPNSISGILTGVILVVARAAGETAPIMLTGAVASMWVEDEGWAKFTPYRLDEQFMAMAMHLNSIARDVPGMPESMKFGSALVLLLLILTINSAAVVLRLYLRRRKRW